MNGPMNGAANTALGRPDSAQQALPQHGFDAATPPLRNPAQQALTRRSKRCHNMVLMPKFRP